MESSIMTCLICSGFTQWFDGVYICRDCNSIEEETTLKRGGTREAIQRLLDWGYQLQFKCHLCKNTFKSEQAHGVAKINEVGEQVELIDVCDKCFEDDHAHNIILDERSKLSDYIFIG